jgi:parallel beta-helix repeat protein
MQGRTRRSIRQAASGTHWMILALMLTLCRSTPAVPMAITVTPDDFEKQINVRSSKGPTIIHFQAGEYYLSTPLEIAGGATLIADGNVTFRGGLLLHGWKRASFNGHDCFAVDLPGVRAGRWYFRELWINEKRATRCRFPATGYLSATMPIDDKTPSNAPWNQGQNAFGYRPGDLPDDLQTTDVEAIIMNRWVEARLPISRLDTAAHRIESSKKSPFQLLDKDLYYLEGSPGFFTSPGQWYLDRSAGVLYYLPRPGETADKLHAIAPLLSTMIKLHGANDVTFRGFHFENSEWNLPEALPGRPMEVGGFGQAAIGVPGAVTLENCSNCRFESCTFEHLGNYALELGKGCQHNTVDHCNFTDFGAGAIKIGDGNISPNAAEQAFGNTVTDCRITDGGQMFPSACGIWIGQSYDNRIEHNEIADLYYTAISDGWTWGYGPSLSHGNRFEKNLVHHIGKKSSGDGPILSDMGGIYTLGAREGTVIAGNVFHDIAGRVYGGWGIYLDEGSSNLLIENNLVYRTTHGGFHLHYGHDNTVQNNIFALGRDVQIARTKADPQLSLTFKRNIVYWDSGVFTGTQPPGVLFDDNLYECIGDAHLKFGGQSWQQWQAAGEDVHSILGKAAFKNVGRNDFSLAPNSAARRIHFQPLDLTDVGPRGK